MISQVESFLCPDKQGTPEEGWRIQQPKPRVTTNNNKDEDDNTGYISWPPRLIRSQTLKMISQVESYLCPDKQGTSEEGRSIQQPKPRVTTKNNKDEDVNTGYISWPPR